MVSGFAEYKPVLNCQGEKMVGSGRWAITVTEESNGEFHFTVLEALSVDDDAFVFEPAILDNTPYVSAMAAWVAGVHTLGVYESDCIASPRNRSASAGGAMDGD